MTYSLPFGLKMKPARRYIPGASIHFQSREGKLFYTVTLTSKDFKFVYVTKEVQTKEQLNKLLTAQSIHELQTLEVVN